MCGPWRVIIDHSDTPWLMITEEKAWTDLTVVIAYHTNISLTAATSRLLRRGASYLRKWSITSFILCPHFHHTSKRKKKTKTQIHSNITAVINYTIKKKCMAHCTHRSELLNTFYEEAFLRVYKVFWRHSTRSNSLVISQL